MKRNRSVWLSAVSVAVLVLSACGGGSDSNSGCPKGEHDGGDGRCVKDGSCSQGFHNVGNGACTSDTGPCSSGLVATGKSDLCCADGYRDGGDRVCIRDGNCSPGYVEDTDGDCVLPPEAPDAPELEVPTHVTADTSFEVKVKAPVGSSTYAWTIVGGTPAAGAGASMEVAAGSSGTVTVSCVETNQAGASGPAGTATSTIVPKPTVPAITVPDFVTAGTAGHAASVEVQGDSTYAWTIEGGTITGDVTGASIEFEAGPAGKIELTCTATNPAGDSAEGTTEVTSVPPPLAPVITAPLAVVVGEENGAEVPEQEGMTYAWTIEDGEPVGAIDGSSVRFRATSSAPVKLTCTVKNAVGTGIDGTKTVAVFLSSYPSIFGEVVAQVAAGEQHTCTRTVSGGVRCWGANGSGQLGDGTTTGRTDPVDVSGLASGVVAIAAGGQHTCALTTAGGVRCWGANGSGQLGDGSTTDRKEPVDVPGLASGVVAIVAGEQHTCALTDAGGVRCWGSNGFGQLGDGSTSDRKEPVNVPGLANGVAAVSAGQYHTCALTTAGGVRCWGSNGYGQLGDGTTTDRREPVDVSGPAGAMVAIAAGASHSCGLTDAGGVRCWGDNARGQLGDGTTTNRTAPKDVAGAGSGVVAIATGGSHTCAMTGTGGVRCWGGNGSGQLGDNTTTNRTAPVGVTGLASGVSAITAGATHTCALTSTGSVRCWGQNGSGQLGDGTTTDRRTSVEVVALASGVVAIATGGNHTCALSSTGGVRCWGANYYGQLGDGSTTDRKEPAEVAGLTNDVVAIAAGSFYTCALTTAGGVRCWGDNYYGQLGDGSTTDRSAPVNVSGLANGVEAIATGYEHTCALTTAGGVRCWGRNGSGQLGDGTTTDRGTPVEVPGLTSGVKAITAGYAHTCALTITDGVRCWGANYHGQLGDGSTTARSAPVNVSGLANGVAAVSAGQYHTCALTTAGGVRCWGNNEYGQLGDGTDTSRKEPVDVSGLTSGVAAITVGYGHTCALTTAGGVRCWGANAFGRLGDGTTTDRPVPMDVSGLASGAEAIAAGGTHSCALTTTGTVRCWGENTSGQLGDGYQINRRTPVAIGAGQSIAFSPPTTVASGAQLSLEDLALASSGLELAFVTWTPEVCTVSGTTLEIDPTANDGALCGVIARQPGRSATEDEGGSVSPAPDQLRIITIVKT